MNKRRRMTYYLVTLEYPDKAHIKDLSVTYGILTPQEILVVAEYHINNNVRVNLVDIKDE